MTPVTYLDASAFVKLVHLEPESAALTAEFQRAPNPVSSTILEIEARRVGLRLGEAIAMQTELTLPRVTTLPLSDAARRLAAEIEPPSLRSLDAIHLATALTLGDVVSAFITYDRRLSEAARAAGLAVHAPA